MSKAKLVITAVVPEGRSKCEVARDYDVSRYWVQQLVKRYETEGSAAFAPRSRRPHHNPRAVPIEVEDRIVRLRTALDNKVSTPAPKPSWRTWRILRAPSRTVQSCARWRLRRWRPTTIPPN
jgi:transposase